MLSMVADYLPKTSRALLAVALMKNGEPSTASKAIISSVKDNVPYESLMDDLLSEFHKEINRPCQYWNPDPYYSQSYMHCIPQLKKEGLYPKHQFHKHLHPVAKSGLDDQMRQYYIRGWEILDFIDIPTSLASRLTDEDLSAILICIDAKSNLKRLNLTHCFSIVGHGLKSLRGSLVLEKLNLGLVRQMEVPQLFIDAQLSEEVVYDILNGILEVEGNTFGRLQVPAAWCSEGENADRRENNGPSERLTQFFEVYNLAFMNKKNLCAYFGYADLQSLMQQLIEIKMEYKCVDDTERCIKCSNFADFDRCTHCSKIVCYACGDDVGNCNGDGCNIVNCTDCMDEEVHNFVSWCSGYNCEGRCGDCRFRECCNGTLDCEACKAMVFDRLLEKFNEKKVENGTKQAEIDQLRQELSQLRCE